MKPTIQNLRQACEAVGATLVEADGGRYIVYQCVAPDGQFWCDTDGYHLVVSWMPGCSDSRASKDAGIIDALERVAEGLRPMTAAERWDTGEDTE